MHRSHKERIMTNFTSLKKAAAGVVLVAALLAPVSVLAQVVRVGVVEAFSTDTWTVWAPSGSTLVRVDGDGTTDLDCYVYDRFGSLLDYDIDSTDLCILDAYQLTSGNIRIEIRNLGSVWNAYVLTVD